MEKDWDSALEMAMGMETAMGTGMERDLELPLAWVLVLG